jgi:transcription initiation factor TFIIB
MSAKACSIKLLPYKVDCIKLICLLIASNDDNKFSTGQTSIVCPLCKSKTAITDPELAEIVCSQCGMVISDKIEETRYEWHTSQLKNRTRRGIAAFLTRHNIGTYTVIGRTDKDGRGHKIKPYMHSTMGRLRTWNFRIQTDLSTDKNFRLAFTELGILKDKLGLSDAIIESSPQLISTEKLRKED